MTETSCWEMSCVFLVLFTVMGKSTLQFCYFREFAFSSLPSSSLSPFHLSPNNDQIPAPQDSWRRPAKPLCLLAPPQGLPGWGSWRSSDARPVGRLHQGSHHGMLGTSTEPLCRSLRGIIFHLSESRSGEKMWGGCVYLNSSQFNSISSLFCFVLFLKDKS